MEEWICIAHGAHRAYRSDESTTVFEHSDFSYASAYLSTLCLTRTAYKYAQNLDVDILLLY